MIYLDNNATTKIDPRVLEAMMPFLTEEYGNAASNHEVGHKIKHAVENARTQVASLIGSEKHEVVFTSGATEAINLALKGLVEQNPDKNHIITVKTEHKAVLDVCKCLETNGCEVSYLTVDKEGLINIDDLKKELKETTLLIAAMLVNNETGVIQPLRQIADIAHEKGAYVMTDATQAVGKTPVDVNELAADLLTFSGHKFGTLKGIGFSFIKKDMSILPFVRGGGQQEGIRSGTENTHGIYSIKLALSDVMKNFNPESLKEAHDCFEQSNIAIYFYL